jgi:hypothetical protein
MLNLKRLRARNNSRVAFDCLKSYNPPQVSSQRSPEHHRQNSETFANGDIPSVKLNSTLKNSKNSRFHRNGSEDHNIKNNNNLIGSIKSSKKSSKGDKVINIQLKVSQAGETLEVI